MKKRYNEKNKLPLTFKYIEILKTQNVGKIHSNMLYFAASEKYQTEHHIREKPLKQLTRLL
ncbi:MAG: hypothetical protein LBE92_04890 [Chryseobacterium sp.]|jgi:hypothetical protein|uniref:hypothetical protein n=1 Tax=Chryseobacterium sp. TaxID=1871047 RepID=UPI0028259BC8|nr:hypothetical protein [Chryseobacterium sp.]MDR2235436.1 hypothetical protein [Chryseobacterium sp.]